MDLARVVRSGATSIPHVRFHERRQEDYWYVGDRKLYGVGAFAQARWPEFPPSHPRRLSEAFLPAVDAKARLAYMDEVGIYYQVLYPNILGFHSHVFLNEMPPELATECVRAYNDWLIECCSADSDAAHPDDDAAVLGHRRLGGRDEAGATTSATRACCSPPATTRSACPASSTTTGSRCSARPRRWA